MKNNDRKILLEAHSPNCPLSVIVEENKDTTYMYLNRMKGGKLQHIICASWLRNHAKSVDKDLALDQEEVAPMLPAEFCNHPEGKKRFKADELQCVWFEDGNGIALLEGNEILCIIPSWTPERFPPYSRDCIKPNDLAMPITKENVLIDVVRRAQDFWSACDGQMWSEFLDARLDLLRKSIGKYTNYYAIDGEKWPIKSMVRFEQGENTYLITIGLSLIPQPKVELFSSSPENLRRIELGLAIKTADLKENETPILEFVSSITNIPWGSVSWVGDGHTVVCGSVFSSQNLFPYAVLVDGARDNSLPNIEFPDFRGDKVNLLWLMPISNSEFGSLKKVGMDSFWDESKKKGRSLIFTKLFGGSIRKIKDKIKIFFGG